MKVLRNLIAGAGLVGIASLTALTNGCATGYSRGPHVDEWGNLIIFEWSNQPLPDSSYPNPDLNPPAFDYEKEMREIREMQERLYNPERYNP
ncbi:hypothetical protein J4463_03765 [Candidatus Pacearchaeota archaeon]|nr:hypothetical protein [Candidatus Pacearchaeota archaeon]